MIAVPLRVCELVWVLRQGANLPKEDVATAVRSMMNAGNLVVNRPAAELELAVLEADGDFTDGAIAHEAAGLGGETFVSFDKQAVTLLTRQGAVAPVLT
jgi:predicted nucleic-acid-binding protein